MGLIISFVDIRLMGGRGAGGGVGCPKNSTIGVALPKLLSLLKAEMVMSELLTTFTSKTFLWLNTAIWEFWPGMVIDHGLYLYKSGLPGGGASNWIFITETQ